jgi:hypothetical protein
MELRIPPKRPNSSSASQLIRFRQANTPLGEPSRPPSGLAVRDPQVTHLLISSLQHHPPGPERIWS